MSDTQPKLTLFLVSISILVYRPASWRLELSWKKERIQRAILPEIKTLFQFPRTKDHPPPFFFIMTGRVFPCFPFKRDLPFRGRFVDRRGKGSVTRGLTQRESNGILFIIFFFTVDRRRWRFTQVIITIIYDKPAWPMRSSTMQSGSCLLIEILPLSSIYAQRQE